MSEKEKSVVHLSESSTESNFVKTGRDRVDSTDNTWEGGSVFSGANKAPESSARSSDSKDYELKGIRASKRVVDEDDEDDDEPTVPYVMLGVAALVALTLGGVVLWFVGLL